MTNILILESSITIYNILKKQLTEDNEKYTIFYSKEFEQAINIIQLKKIELIILNKGTNGLNFIKAINKSKYYSEIPIILTTTDMEDPDISNVKISGLLKKPFVKENSMEMVEKALEN